MNMLMRKTWNPLNGYVSAAAAFDHSLAPSPALDVIENESGFVVKAALPGWSSDQIEVKFEQDVLTLSGEPNEEAEKPEPARIHWKEIPHNAFSRSIKLPAEIDAEKIAAEFANGVLTLTLPKAEVLRPRQIKIAVK